METVPEAPAAVPRAAAPRRRRALVAVLAVLGAAAVAGALLAVDRTTGSSLRRLSLPRAVAEFRLQRSLSPEQITALASGGTFAGFDATELRSAQVGVYGQDGRAEPALVLVGLAARSDGDVRSRLASTDSDNLADDMLAGLGAVPAASVDPGPLGGTIESGLMGGFGAAASLGVWADRSTVGVLELLEARSAYATADLTRRFRESSEH